MAVKYMFGVVLMGGTLFVLGAYGLSFKGEESFGDEGAVAERRYMPREVKIEASPVDRSQDKPKQTGGTSASAVSVQQEPLPTDNLPDTSSFVPAAPAYTSDPPRKADDIPVIIEPQPIEVPVPHPGVPKWPIACNPCGEPYALQESDGHRLIACPMIACLH